MLTGNLVRVKQVKGRVIPLYLPRERREWLEVAESLLLIFREGVGRTRLEIEDEIDEMVGEGMATLAHRGLAKVLEDRAEFEVVSDLAPDELREAVFTTAAEYRRSLRAAGHRAPFRRDEVLRRVGGRLALEPERVAEILFADLKEENRMLTFEDMEAQQLVDRYNVALAQSVLLRAVLITLEVRREQASRYRQLFRWLKFHRLLYRVEGSPAEGYAFKIDGPMSLFSATNKYGLQMALFLPTLLDFKEFRLTAELRWGPKKEPRTFQLDATDGLVPIRREEGSYVPPEFHAFIERFRQIAVDWEVEETAEIVELGREGVWVPDYRFVHKPSGKDVLVEILGFWKKSGLERLLRLLPDHGPPRYLLAVSDRLKVDEEAVEKLAGPILKFKEIPNAQETLTLLRGFIG